MSSVIFRAGLRENLQTTNAEILHKESLLTWVSYLGKQERLAESMPSVILHKKGIQNPEQQDSSNLSSRSNRFNNKATGSLAAFVMSRYYRFNFC